MTRGEDNERTLILATRGRDATVARGILQEVNLKADVCADVHALLAEIMTGAELAIITEEAFRGVDTRALVNWVASQPVWSDFPFIVLTEHGGGLERRLRRRGVIVDGTSRPVGSTQVTWGRPEVGDRPPPGADPYP